MITKCQYPVLVREKYHLADFVIFLFYFCLYIVGRPRKLEKTLTAHHQGSVKLPPEFVLQNSEDYKAEGHPELHARREKTR